MHRRILERCTSEHYKWLLGWLCWSLPHRSTQGCGLLPAGPRPLLPPPELLMGGALMGQNPVVRP